MRNIILTKQEEKVTYFVDEETLTEKELKNLLKEEEGKEEDDEEPRVQTKNCGCLCKKHNRIAKDMEANLASNEQRTTQCRDKA